MADTKKTPAQIRIAAPPSLAADFAPAGYAVELVVTRTGKTGLKNDPGALPMLVNAPFSDTERKSLDGLVAAYETERSGAE